MKGLELNDFVVHLSKLRFLQLICKVSLIFKSNLEFHSNYDLFQINKLVQIQ